MSTEKMILIRTLGLIVPQTAILSSAIMRKEERNYTMPQASVEANPIVVSSRVNAYYLYLALDSKYIPNFNDEDEGEDEKPTRRGRKRADAVEAMPKPATYMLALHEDLLEDSVETTLSKSEALQSYIAEGGEQLDEVRKNLGRLEKFVREMNAAQDSLAPESSLAGGALADLLSPGLHNDINATNETAIEIHADEMRKAAEKARASYDKVIGWFERKVLVSSSGSAEPVNVTSDIPADASSRSGEEETSLTVKKLIDLVKAELTVIL